MISLSDLAKNKIKKQLENRNKGVGIRVGVKNSGCSGLSYVLEYLDDAGYEEGITDYSFDNVVVRVSNKDLIYLFGLEIDYVKKGLNEGFEFRNPNETARCGCGESFKC